jgi:putative transposase
VAFYLLANGCKWSTLPHDFPEGTVRDDIHQWRRNGLWERIHDILRRQVGEQVGKEPEPNAGSIGSQFAKAAQTGGMRGYDAGKEIYGIKRHIPVDTLGLVPAVVVHPANIQGSRRGQARLRECEAQGAWPRMLCVWADGGYAGKLIEWVFAFCQLALEIVIRNDDVKGFKLLPKRWVVERTFFWRSNYLRLSKHYEYWNETGKDVDDPRESPGFELMEILLEKGAVVEYNDPHIPSLPSIRRYPNRQMASQELTVQYLQTRDCLLIATDHSSYDWNRIAQHAALVVDTRNDMKGVIAPKARIVSASGPGDRRASHLVDVRTFQSPLV